MDLSSAVVLIGLALVIGIIVGRRVFAKSDYMGVGATSRSAPDNTASKKLSDNPRIAQALESLPLGIVIVDKAGQNIYRNKEGKESTRGRYGNALIEAAIDDVIAKATVGQPVERSVDLYGPPARCLSVVGNPIYNDGELTGAVIVTEDVTHEQQMDRARRDLVANASHELRTPVGAVIALTETLVQTDDPEIQARMLQRVHNQALRLGETIEDLLTLSSVESPSSQEEFAVVDLVSIIGVAVEQTVDIAEKRSVVVEAVNHSSTPVLVEGDQRQLVSAVTNLCSNACKYSEPDSQVIVSIDHDDESALINVQDTGVGIPEVEQARIFERFYRVDSARSRGTGGSGLGLSIVRHVVINHKGNVSVRSVEGQGSTFSVTLPLASKARPISASEAPTTESSDS